MAKQIIYSLSISGRAALDLHSLNNEGGEGNQTLTRMVTIVHKVNGKYEPTTVNAISGDMFKHIQAEHLYRLANGNLPLCAGCQKFSGSRSLDDPEFMKEVVSKKVGKKWKYDDSQVINALVERCAIDDMEGILIAPQRGKKKKEESGADSEEQVEESKEEKGRASSRSVPRKSVAEFGWVVGIPTTPEGKRLTQTDSYFHVRFASDRGEEEVEQPIFHRPASSGVYAMVANFEIARIGFNDIRQQYAIGDDERAKRFKVFAESILFTFIEPNGAMRGTQNPHILGFEGAVTISTQVMPAPALSALDANYRDELNRVAAALNQVRANGVTVHKFDSMGEFAEILRDVIANGAPYKFNYGG